MELPVLFAIIAVSVVYRRFFNKRGISWFIFAGSIFLLFYFQPISTIRYFDFWIPSRTLLIAVIVWEIVASDERKNDRKTKITYFSLAGFFLILLLMSFLPRSWYGNFVSIPPYSHILVFLVVGASMILIIRKLTGKRRIAAAMIVLLLIIFFFIKNTDLSLFMSEVLRRINDQAISLASSSEIIWIGYSYFAFRIIHVLIEFRRNKKPAIDLHTFVGYVLFFPALLAGPIMYMDKYQQELENKSELDQSAIIHAFKRIGLGLFQKFIFADLLAIISLNNALSTQVSEPKWMWLFVVVYSLRIYFDFSGYTHIAIGIANILGINLPENFDKPLRSPTLTIFWNKWHITLTQWFRAYYFNPVSRFFKKNLKKINPVLVLAFMQITTMIVIGLWHGVSYNFIVWGAWIGVGLFIQNQISGIYSKKLGRGIPFWQMNRLARAFSNAVTFLYITMGWVWFALPSLTSSINVYAALLGVR